MISFTESNSDYHANPAIGSGDIRRMVESARLYKDGVDGICDRESKALLFGIASHMCLLEPERYANEVAIKPDGMSFATTIGKDWRKAQVGKVIVTYEDAQHLTRMQERMPDEVRAIFSSSRKEATVRTELDGLTVQCRPDLWQTDAHRFYDLKTIDGIGGIDRAIWSHLLYVQLAWYGRVLEAETGHRHASRLIFAEKCPPYRWKVIDLDLDYRALAEKAIDDAVAQIKARNKSGCWEDSADLFDIASPPEWAANGLAADFDGETDELEAEAV